MSDLWDDDGFGGGGATPGDGEEESIETELEDGFDDPDDADDREDEDWDDGDEV